MFKPHRKQANEGAGGASGPGAGRELGEVERLLPVFNVKILILCKRLEIIFLVLAVVYVHFYIMTIRIGGRPRQENQQYFTQIAFLQLITLCQSLGCTECSLKFRYKPS